MAKSFIVVTLFILLGCAFLDYIEYKHTHQSTTEPTKCNK